MANTEKKEEKSIKKSLFSNSKIFQKIKSIKHIEIIVVVIFVAILLLIYSSTFATSNINKTSGSYISVSEYTKMLEDKLSQVLSQISGAGKVSVMVTIDGGIEYVYASSTEEKTNTNTSGSNTTSSSTKTSEPQNGIIVREILPQVSGVIVVAQGAKDTYVKLEILKAVQAILNVPPNNVEVLVGS